MGHCFSKSHDHDNRVPISYEYDSPPPHHHHQLPQRTQQQQPRPQPQPQPQPRYGATNSDPTPSFASSSLSSSEKPILDKPYIDMNSLYTFGKELGRGQFGVTYLCVEKSTGRKFACKSIPKRKLTRKKEIQDVKREIMILQHLTGQPNIVEFKGAYEDRQSVHLVMELCYGGELFDRITAKGSYSEREAASTFRQIVNVVHACHFMGVMHRDLKPENFLMVSKDDKAPLKATDFGLSVFIEEG